MNQASLSVQAALAPMIARMSPEQRQRLIIGKKTSLLTRELESVFFPEYTGERVCLGYEDTVTVHPPGDEFDHSTFFGSRDMWSPDLGARQRVWPTEPVILGYADVVIEAQDKSIQNELPEGYAVEPWMIAQLVRNQDPTEDGPLNREGVNIFYVHGLPPVRISCAGAWRLKPDRGDPMVGYLGGPRFPTDTLVSVCSFGNDLARAAFGAGFTLVGRLGFEPTGKAAAVLRLLLRV